MDQIELSAEPRTVLGKQVKALRRQEILPANVYGGGESMPVQLPTRSTEQVLRRAGKTNLIRLSVPGQQPTTVMVKDYQRHPTRGSLLHVDFYRVAMDQLLRVDVPLRLIGEAPAIKTHEATVFSPLSTVSVEAMPAELPEAIEVDVSGLEDLDGAVYVRDLSAPAGATILTDGDELVVKLLPPSVAVEVEETTEEAAEGATAEGEAVAAEGGESSDES